MTMTAKRWMWFARCAADGCRWGIWIWDWGRRARVNATDVTADARRSAEWLGWTWGDGKDWCPQHTRRASRAEERAS